LSDAQTAASPASDVEAGEARAPSLSSRVQARLCRCYGIDGALEVDDFVVPSDDGEREQLIIRQGPDGLELGLCLPRAVAGAARANSLDELCQVVEGVSHFVYVSERARREQPVTELELELQAEVDKWVMLVDPCHGGFDAGWSARVRDSLYGRVRYAHPRGSERGDRYRMANELAARFAGGLERRCRQDGPTRIDDLRQSLRRFYWASQGDKLAMAQAA
jgi:hypothetical protein